MTEGRRALVTGAARGIGAAIAARLRRRTASSVLTLDRREGCDLALDVARDQFPDRWRHRRVRRQRRRHDDDRPGHRMTAEQWQRDIDVNLTGAFRTVQACLGRMRERRYGRIVVISSVAALGGLPGQVAYAASKAGQLGMVRTLASENAARGITVNAVLPGLVPPSRCSRCPRRCCERALAALPERTAGRAGRDRRCGRVPGRREAAQSAARRSRSTAPRR